MRVGSMRVSAVQNPNVGGLDQQETQMGLRSGGI